MSYNLEWRDTATLTTTTVTGITDLFYDLTGLTASTEYEFRVQETDGVDTSAFSEWNRFDTARNLRGDVQTYTLTGAASALQSARNLQGVTQAYTLTGAASALQSARNLQGDVQTYSLAGAASASLLKNATLPGVTQAYTLTGAASALQSARNLRGDVQTYTLTGAASALQSARNLRGDVQTYSLAGQGVNFALRTKEYISFYGSQPNIPGDKVGFYD